MLVKSLIPLFPIYTHLKSSILEYFFDCNTFTCFYNFSLVNNAKRTITSNFVSCVFKCYILSCSTILCLLFMYFGWVIITTYILVSILFLRNILYFKVLVLPVIFIPLIGPCAIARELSFIKCYSRKEKGYLFINW